MAKTGYFFDDEADLKQYLPVSISLSIEDLQTQFETVTDRYIHPKIGIFVDAVLVAYQAETANALIAPLQKAIANFALYHQLPILEVQISDSGVSRYETDNEKTAYKYQIDNLKYEILNNGFSALESVLSIVESDKDNPDYASYLASDQRADNTQNLIWNSIEFHKHNRLGFAASTFDALVPTLQAVEDFIIRSYIGDAYFEELVTGKRAATLTDDNKAALLLIQKAITNFVIEFSAKAGAGKPTRDGFKVVNTSNENTGLAVAPIDQIRLSTNYSKMNGYMYISKLQRLLSTEDKYATYKTFIESKTVTETTDKEKLSIYRF